MFRLSYFKKSICALVIMVSIASGMDKPSADDGWLQNLKKIFLRFTTTDSMTTAGAVDPIEDAKQKLQTLIREEKMGYVEALMRQYPALLNAEIGSWALTPLMMIAVTEGRSLPLVQRLVELGAAVNYKNKNNHTALSLAVTAWNSVVIKLLVDAGANIHYRHPGFSTSPSAFRTTFLQSKVAGVVPPVHIRSLQIPMIQSLLDNGAELVDLDELMDGKAVREHAGPEIQEFLNDYFKKKKIT